MSALVIAGSAVPVLASSGDVEHENRVVVARRWSGALAVVERSPISHARVLTVQVRTSEEYPLGSVLALQGTLEADGWLTVSGDVWGDEAQAEATDVQRQDGPLDGDATLSFTLHERGALS